ncbi:MAG: fatty acid hydroxylase superfamily protein [Rhodospirillales bacterium]|nr:fatty acid hydroxylase superfamily protein [Rhodospirillales bacterium]
MICMAGLLDSVLAFCTPAILFTAAIVAGRLIERLRPVETDHPVSAIVIDYKLAALNFFLNSGMSLLPGISAAMVLGTTGSGFIHLKADGWWFVPSLLIYLLTLDLLLYGFHRAQHEIPILWAMHSLHHSSDTLSVSTGARHYWLEATLRRLFLFPLTAFIFSVPAVVSTTAVLLYFVVDACAHLNVRISLGRFALWVNNPQYHRIHHSVRQEHANKNFSDLLPLWDLVFGTVWRPSPDDWPATGLATLEKPSSIFEGRVWPLRRQLRPRQVGR